MIFHRNCGVLAQALARMSKKHRLHRAERIFDPKWQSPQKKHVKPIIGFVSRAMETFSITKG
jgi:hypothetical protein